MDSPVTFPVPEPSLKIARPSSEKWAATLAEERLRLQEDQEALREREDNLREYESRLRSLQAEIEAGRVQAQVPAPMPMSTGTQSPLTTLTTRSTPALFQRPSSRTPFSEDPALQTAWEKLHRAREILEAEQKNLRDDRITMREHELMLKRREEEIAEREARLAEREALFVTAAGPAVVPPSAPGGSAVSRFTRAPFDMARSVFGGRKSG